MLIWLQLTILYLPRKDEWLSWPRWLTYSGTIYPHKWTPISCRSSTGRKVCRSKTDVLQPQNQPCVWSVIQWKVNVKGFIERSRLYCSRLKALRHASHSFIYDIIWNIFVKYVPNHKFLLCDIVSQKVDEWVILMHNTNTGEVLKAQSSYMTVSHTAH